MRRRPFRRRRPRASPRTIAREHALLGALILEPGMIRHVASRRPPWSFADPRSAFVMQALYCLAFPNTPLTVEDVVETLERHDALARVGGRAFVEALVAPGPGLDRARGELADRRRALPPVDEEPIVEAARRLLGEREPELG